MQSFEYKFDIYKDKSGGTRLRFKAPNGEVCFQVKGISKKINCKCSRIN